MFKRSFYVYILASRSDVLYTGMTNDIVRRMWEHTRKRNQGFAARYGVSRLVYVEPFDFVNNAITREKQIKGWSREKKKALIAEANPAWEDLSCEWEPLYREIDTAEAFRASE